MSSLSNNIREISAEENSQAKMNGDGIVKKKKKKKKSIVLGEGAVAKGDGAANGDNTPKKKKKKKLKKTKSESALNLEGPVKRKKKKKKKKPVDEFGGSSSSLSFNNDDDDDDFLPDSPLRDGPKSTFLRSDSLDRGSTHSTSLGSIDENNRSPGRRPAAGRGRGMMRAQSLNIGRGMNHQGSVNFGRGGGMNRQGSIRNVLNASGHGGRGRGMGMRQSSRGGGLSLSEHGPRPGRGMGMRQPSRGGGLSFSEHGPRSGRGMGMRQPSRGGGLSISEHGGRGMHRQPSRRLSAGRGLDGGSNHGGRGMHRQPSRRLSTGSSHSGSGQSSMRGSRTFAGGYGHNPSRMTMDGHIEDKLGGRGRPALADSGRGMSQQSMSISSHSFDFSFGEEPKWKQALRYLHILQPSPDETRIQRKQRYLIWLALFLDFVAALVSIFSYTEATRCCEVPIFNAASAAIDWDKFIRVTTYVYTALLFIEVIPVLKKGLPINLVNPLLGFTITFGMFFDDRIIEAIVMWLIEASAIACEVAVFFLVRKEFLLGNKRIEDATNEIEIRKPKSKRKFNPRLASKKNLNDEEEGANSDLKHLDTFRLERERRRLKVSQSAEEINLRYHLIGTIINCGLVALSLGLIAGIGKNGGLCISEMESPPIFANDQKERCSRCFTPESLQDKNIWDEEGYKCELCDESGKHTCYFGYVSSK